MPIKFVEEKKRQKYLILVFLAVALISAVVLWQGYFKKEEPVSPTPGLSFREVKINFDVLESPVLKELQPFEEISLEGLLPLEVNVGRENPFISY
jgi:hypothetical protein